MREIRSGGGTHSGVLVLMYSLYTQRLCVLVLTSKDTLESKFRTHVTSLQGGNSKLPPDAINATQPNQECRLW